MYKPELKEELLKLLLQFFKEEQGNRITSFNMNGLTGVVGALFETFEEKKDGKKKTGD